MTMDDSESEFAFVASNTPVDSDGVYTLEVDPETGAADPIAAVAGGENPSFLAIHPDGEHLYVVNEVDGGSIQAYSIDLETGALTPLNRQSSGGAGPCHCSVDSTGSYVFVANYRGGTVAVLPIAGDGRLGEPVDAVEREGSSIDPERQNSPHPHSITPGPENRFVYAADLGTDEVAVYELSDDGTLRPVHSVKVREGAGPRHLDFHPDGSTAYLVNELESTLTTYEYDSTAGYLETVATVDTLGDSVEGENYPADVHVHPSGERVYASNRGADSIAVFDLDDPRSPTLVDTTATRGEWPRNFALDGTGAHLFAENQHADGIVSFQIDENAGTLTPTGDTVEVTAPMCMTFLTRR